MSNKIQVEENEQQFEVRILGFCKLANFVSNLNRIELLNFVNGVDLEVNYYEFQLSDASSKWRVHKTLGMLEQFDKLHLKLPKLVEDQHAPSYICDQLIGYVKQFKQAEIREFMHFSDVQFPRKILNLYVYKRAGGRHKKQNCCQIYKPCNQNFKKRYITITKDGIQISKTQFGLTAKVRDMLLFDQSLTIQFENHFKITIRTHTRDLCIKANDVYDFIQILAVLYKLEEQYQNQQQNRFKSFAPVRSKNQVQMLVDGKEYYELLVKDIHSAQNEIFITDWWLSPELHLIRPQQQETRLDNLLQKKAQEGLKIYIIVFNEPTVALTLNSKHTIKVLSGLHNNIMVLRHPSSVVPMLWSHHEKLFIIDQKIAYIGGLDLCYGRMDTQSHPLFEEYLNQFPGCDYSNCRVCDFKDVANYTYSDIDRTQIPRMPWHDIHCRLNGSSVKDLVKHFIQYWYFACADLEKKSQFQPPEIKQSAWHNKFTQIGSKIGTFLKDKLHRQSVTVNIAEGQTQLAESPKQHRQRSMSQSQANEMQNFQLDDTQYFQIVAGESTQQAEKPAFAEQKLKLSIHTKPIGHSNVQVLRSANSWSLGLKKPENSIYMAYLNLISQAEEYIYIENQFFITSLAGPPVVNSVGVTLLQRIKRAHINKEPFHVTIVLPLLPGFEGEIDDSKSSVMKLQLHYEYMSICRGGSSLLEQLEKIVPNPSNYVTLVGLRNHGINSKGVPHTEIVYVHSKLMIVDDRFMLCGSANINDRSLKGSRDSEMAVVIEDRQSAGDLRRKLFREHFEIDDFGKPLLVVKQIQERIKNNTQLYREIFACYPDDTIKSLRQLKELKGNLIDYQAKCHYIKGIGVEWPTEFLIEESLQLGVFTKEYIVSDVNFT